MPGIGGPGGPFHLIFGCTEDFTHQKTARVWKTFIPADNNLKTGVVHPVQPNSQFQLTEHTSSR